MRSLQYLYYTWDSPVYVTSVSAASFEGLGQTWMTCQHRSPNLIGQKVSHPLTSTGSSTAEWNAPKWGEYTVGNEGIQYGTLIWIYFVIVRQCLTKCVCVLVLKLGTTSVEYSLQHLRSLASICLFALCETERKQCWNLSNRVTEQNPVFNFFLHPPHIFSTLQSAHLVSFGFRLDLLRETTPSPLTSPPLPSWCAPSQNQFHSSVHTSGTFSYSLFKRRDTRCLSPRRDLTVFLSGLGL